MNTEKTEGRDGEEFLREENAECAESAEFRGVEAEKREPLKVRQR
jgi:hypothetical protein